MHCMGSCYLKKQLLADDNREKPAGKISFEKDLQSLVFFQKVSPFDFSIAACRILHVPNYTDFFPKKYVVSFFQPPQISRLLA